MFTSYFMPKRQVSRTPEFARRVAREFGRKLKAHRKSRRMAQDTFAKGMRISRTTASYIEQGHQRVFLDQVYQAASVLGIRVDDLLPERQLLTDEANVHAPVDDPLTARAVRQVAAVVKELELHQSKSRKPRRAPKESQ